MKKISTKQVCKMVFMAVLLAAAVYILRDSLGPAFQEIKKTDANIFILACLVSVLYSCTEGVSFTYLAKRYNRQFSLRKGIACSFYASFYRTVSLGSAPAAATVYFLNREEMNAGNALGICSVNYILHKASISLYSLIMMALCPVFLKHNYENYRWMMFAGYGITLVIVTVLVLVCVSEWFHKILINITNRFARKEKWKNRLERFRNELKNLRNVTKVMMTDWKVLLSVIGLNILKLTCWYLIPFILLRNMMDISFVSIICMTSLTTALAGVLPAPAGIGSTEFVYILLFSVVTGEVLAAYSAVLYRLLTYILPFLIGGIYVFFIKRKRMTPTYEQKQRP